MKALKNFKTWLLGIGLGLLLWAMIQALQERAEAAAGVVPVMSSTSVTGIVNASLIWTNTGGIVRPVTNDNVVYSPGQEGVGAQPVNDGTSVKFLWVPGRGAIRAGFLSGGSTNWDYTSLGLESASFGADTLALAQSSFAIGSSTAAHSQDSFAGGNGSIATNSVAFAYGLNVKARGANSVAFSQNSISSGNASFACGADGVASGNFSFVANDFNTASGISASAFGFSSIASGENSFAAGNTAKARDTDTIALGTTLIASNVGAIAIGVNVTNLSSRTTMIGSNINTLLLQGSVAQFTNMIVGVTPGVTASNAWVGGTYFAQSGMLFTNLNGAGTMSNLATVPIAAHALTNIGDRVVAEWGIKLANSKASTSQFQIFYGSATPLDTALVVSSNSAVRAGCTISRTGNTSQHVEAWLAGPHLGSFFWHTNMNVEIAETNGIATTLGMKGGSNAVGAHTNNYFTVEWKPGAR